MCADTCAVLQNAGQEPNPADFDLPTGDLEEIANRLLRALPDGQAVWLTRLALPPRFDEGAALAAYASVPTAEAEAAWDLLTDLSFMNPSPDGVWWTLHGQMRDILRSRVARNPEKERKEQERWQQYWHSRSRETSDDFAGLAWYHAWCLDPGAALFAWHLTAEAARIALDMAAHLQIINWWNPTGIETNVPTEAAGVCLNSLGIHLCQATLGDRDANLKRAIACYESALRVYKEDTFPVNWATTQNNLGTAYRDLPLGDRDRNLRQAIACYESALRVYKEDTFPVDWAITRYNMALMYVEIGTANVVQEALQDAERGFRSAGHIRYAEEVQATRRKWEAQQV